MSTTNKIQQWWEAVSRRTKTIFIILCVVMAAISYRYPWGYPVSSAWKPFFQIFHVVSWITTGFFLIQSKKFIFAEIEKIKEVIRQNRT